MSRYSVGLDFGTESVRAVVANVADGTVVASAVAVYPEGVIDRQLPGSAVPLPRGWALQSSTDWLTSMEAAVREALAGARIDPHDVLGIGIDFTACTVLPTTADGVPLHTLPGGQDNPHAWPKLWKHHGAQAQADRVNAAARDRNERWLARYGGRISSEWLLPKALEILEAAPQTYDAAERIVEGADWVVWQLTGRLARNACAAGYKGTWHANDGYPSEAFLATLHPSLADLYTTRMGGPVLTPGSVVGELTPAWAERLGLGPGIPVAASIIDAHAAVLGGGIAGPGAMFIMMGTSSCHLLMAEREVLAEGISGVVEGGIVPGLFAYEAGQAGVGDIFAWFVRSGVPPALHDEAARLGRSLHAVLSEQAATVRPGESGLLALDWWNGCRTPLVDADLSGAVLGYTLQTTPAEIYRALIEATAFGTRLIIDTFRQAGLPIDRLRVGGGLTQNDLVLDIYAGVTGLPVEVAQVEQASALGAAILGAVAGGAFGDLREAVLAMTQPPVRVVAPNAAATAVYTALYGEYRRLVDLMGRDAESSLKRLRALRTETRGTVPVPLT